MRLPRALVLLSAASALARDSQPEVDEDLSFGLRDQIWGSSHDHNNVPGWHLIGDQGHNPDILSDRIILTPPHYGNRRGAIWADRPETYPSWTAEFEFRVSGAERGSGNLQLWYAKDGQQDIGTSSIYTVGKFDGLALVISQYGGHGGSIRGFLNDGQTSYKDHYHVDRLAFGQCDFSYRNLGHFTHISMKQTHDAFEVEVDNRPCFKTHKVRFGFSTGDPDLLTCG
jgi:lectin, mannose-binding 1